MIQIEDMTRDELLTIVRRLPKTADGVPVLAGDTIYCPNGHAFVVRPHDSRVYCLEGKCYSDGCQNDSGSGEHYNFEKCSSQPKIT